MTLDQLLDATTWKLLVGFATLIWVMRGRLDALLTEVRGNSRRTRQIGKRLRSHERLDNERFERVFRALGQRSDARYLYQQPRRGRQRRERNPWYREVA